jgi:hypothetical protein
MYSANNDKISPEPTPGFETPEQARAEAKRRSANIGNHYYLLCAITLQHEKRIKQIWLKNLKLREQKLKILLNAWPNMPGKHRPDFDTFRKNMDADEDPESMDRSHFVWTHINQEDLTEPNNLLLRSTPARDNISPYSQPPTSRLPTLAGRPNVSFQYHSTDASWCLVQPAARNTGRSCRAMTTADAVGSHP